MMSFMRVEGSRIASSRGCLEVAGSRIHQGTYLTFEMKFQIEYCILILLAFQRPLAVVSQTQAANTVSNEEKEEVVR